MLKKSQLASRCPAVTEALTAKEKGLLMEWVKAYLEKEGNRGLLDALSQNRTDYIDLVEFPLSLLKKIDGPEEIPNRQPLDVWETRVSILETNIGNGEFPPPLIVTDFWKPLEIVDGNHRHEALIRNGIDAYWTIFIFCNHESKELLSELGKFGAKQVSCGT
ncbi:MAG: hypothetical protein Q8Q49_04930 [bacterium]|nr:hypothetical protein [bacterium]